MKQLKSVDDVVSGTAILSLLEFAGVSSSISSASEEFSHEGVVSKKDTSVLMPSVMSGCPCCGTL